MGSRRSSSSTGVSARRIARLRKLGLITSKQYRGKIDAAARDRIRRLDRKAETIARSLRNGAYQVYKPRSEKARRALSVLGPGRFRGKKLPFVLLPAIGKIQRVRVGKDAITIETAAEKQTFLRVRSAEYLRNPAAALQRVRKKMRPGALVAIQTSNGATARHYRDVDLLESALTALHFGYGTPEPGEEGTPRLPWFEGFVIVERRGVPRGTRGVRGHTAA